MADYPIIEVRPEDIIGDEGMGSKPKFWFRRDGRRWLFKEAREGTGEDWAEKIVAEVARVAGIPAAIVDWRNRADVAVARAYPSQIRITPKR